MGANETGLFVCLLGLMVIAYLVLRSLHRLEDDAEQIADQQRYLIHRLKCESAHVLAKYREERAEGDACER